MVLILLSSSRTSSLQSQVVLRQPTERDPQVATTYWVTEPGQITNPYASDSSPDTIQNKKKKNKK
jgi:hypothetical protein